MADNTTEQSVELALAELREVFRGKWIAFDFAEDHTVWPDGVHHVESRYMVQVESANGDLMYQSETKTLNKLMADLRQWHAEQAKVSK